MDKNLLTVTQYAKAEGVSRQAVYQRIKSSDKWMKEHCQVVDGRLYIDLTTFHEKQESDVDNIDNVIDKEVDKKLDELTFKLTALERENEILREQIAEKDNQIHSLIAGWRESQVSIMYQLTGKEGSPEDKVSDSEQSVAESPEPEIQERRSVFDRLFKIRRK